MNQPPTDPERIADSVAHRLLGRAAALDSARMTVAQLREAAIEAGISSAAFEAALAEWRRSADAPTPRRSATAWLESTVRNTAALAAGWIGVATLAAVGRVTAAPWLVHKLADPVGLALGAVVAVRLKARAATILLGGLAVSQAAEFLMDLLTGAPAIHGSGAHFGLMIAGVVGVAVGARLLRAPTNQTPDALINVGIASPEGRSDESDPSASRSVSLTIAEVVKRSKEARFARILFY
jgi:hypothetical protein